MEWIEVVPQVESLGEGMPGPPGARAILAMDLGLGESAGANGGVGILNFDID
jgi:hypothetical protein